LRKGGIAQAGCWMDVNVLRSPTEANVDEIIEAVGVLSK
jgi:hypothetical protein